MGKSNINECPSCSSEEIVNSGGCMTCMNCGVPVHQDNLYIIHIYTIK